MADASQPMDFGTWLNNVVTQIATDAAGVSLIPFEMANPTIAMVDPNTVILPATATAQGQLALTQQTIDLVQPSITQFQTSAQQLEDSVGQVTQAGLTTAGNIVTGIANTAGAVTSAASSAKTWGLIAAGTLALVLLANN